MEATVVQLAQTIGEVIGSPRVVEFDMTVTMNAQITLVPDAGTGKLRNKPRKAKSRLGSLTIWFTTQLRLFERLSRRLAD